MSNIETPTTTPSPASIQLAFRSLLGNAEQGLFDRCEQRFALRLLLKCMLDLKEEKDFYQTSWVERLLATIPEDETDSPIRYYTTRIVVTALRDSPWSYKRTSLGTPQHCFSTINTIQHAIKLSITQINAELCKAEQKEGIDLTFYETEEMLEELSPSPENHDDDGDKAVVATTSRSPKKRGRKFTLGQGTATYSTTAITHRARKWSNPELLHLLRIIRDNIDKIWDDRVRLHNDTYVVPESVKEKGARSKEGVKQRVMDEIKLTVQGLEERCERRIAELEAS